MMFASQSTITPGSGYPYGSGPMGQPIMTQDQGTIVFQIKPQLTIENRLPYMGLKHEGFHPYDDMLQLKIVESNLVFINRKADADDPNPFASFNGLEDFLKATNNPVELLQKYHDTYKFVGFAKDSYQFGADAQGFGLTLQSKGVANFHNLSGSMIPAGTPLTWRPDIKEFVSADIDGPMAAKRSRMAGTPAIKGIIVPCTTAYAIDWMKWLEEKNYTIASSKEELARILGEATQIGVGRIINRFETVIGWCAGNVEDNAIGQIVMY